jgi:EAL domain-containing protein (putative c-di-GMP-specific phosphodiesterase class I)
LRSTPDPSLVATDLDTMRLFADFVARLLEQHVADHDQRQAQHALLQAVLEQRRFSVAFQPVRDVAQDRLVFYEALARFPDAEGRPPDQWFAEAAAAGLQGPLELAVMELAMASLQRIPAGVYLSLNVSPTAILHPDFPRVFEGQPLQRLMLEITEHSSITDYEAIARRLDPLRKRGLKLAVDDAGAGFASFRHILQLRPDVIKLDASLIRHIDRERGSRALAAALIRFAEETGCRVVAEGVETEGELAVLRELHVDKAQGFLLGRPGPLPVAH